MRAASEPSLILVVDVGRPGRTGGRRTGHPRPLGLPGSTYAKIPYKGKNKPDSQKQANKAHAKLRALCERANAQLKTWKTLTKLRCCPWRAGQLARPSTYCSYAKHNQDRKAHSGGKARGLLPPADG